MTRHQLYSDLPAELLEADDILRRYGRWCRGGQGGPARCGSAEGQYRAPQDDEDRQPAEPIMPRTEVDRVSKALGELPMMTLCVIQWLYVTPGQVQKKMRETGLQPKHLRERHLEGVRLFWSVWRKSNATMTNDTIAMRSVVIENCTT